MIPSAKMAMRPRPPPENRLSSPRMFEPPKFFWIAATAEEFTPGAGRWVPSRYRNSMAPVNRTLLRISPILNAPRIVAITGLPLDGGRRGGHDHLAGAAGRLDGRLGSGAEAMRVHGQRLGDLALGQHLDRDALARGQALAVHGLQRDRGPGLEARLEVGQVDRLGVGPERLEGHRLLHVRAAQLA